MAAPNSSASNQDNSDATFRAVVSTQFCFNSPTTFDVWKKSAVSSNVGGIWTIKDKKGREKFKLEELALPETGLALKDSGENPILTVKPKDKMLDKILTGKKQWNVFPTMESALQQGKFTVETSGDSPKIDVSLKDYKIEGSFAERIFTIYDISRIAAEVIPRRIAAEVKLDSHSVYDVEVKTGYDQAFIFGLVAVLEQIRKPPTKK